jgi:site-specific recombinase XerD
MSQPATESPTWPQTVDRFDAHLVELERSPHTRANYREDLGAFRAWYLATYGEEPAVATLTATELREWKELLRVGRQLEPATVNRKLAALRSLLRWAEGEGLAREVRLPRSLKQVNPPPRWLGKAAQRALLRAAEKHGGYRDAPLVQVLLHTGLRVDELVKLTWDKVTLKDRSGSITVVGKGRKQRTIPLNAEARAAFQELRVVAPKTAPQVLHGKHGPLTARGVQGSLRKLAHWAKIPDLSPHVLRHTFGKNLADTGAGIQLIADLMGHESLETTRRYIQPGHADLAAAVDKLAGGED